MERGVCDCLKVLCILVCSFSRVEIWPGVSRVMKLLYLIYKWASFLDLRAVQLDVVPMTPGIETGIKHCFISTTH